MLRKWLREALTKDYYIHAPNVRGKKAKRAQIPPNEKLVLGLSFAIVMVICLTILEVVYMIVFQQWNSEIFATITGLSGTILGVFLGAKS